MRVIGVDPSLACTGLAAIDFTARKVLAWEAVRTKPDKATGRKTDDTVRRLIYLSQEVKSFLMAHPSAVAIEGQVGASFGAASMANIAQLMMGYGCILGSLDGKLPIVLMPAQVKARCTGNKGASKTEAWEAARKHFSSFPPSPKAKPDREAVEDAVCVAVAALPELQRIHDMG